MDEKRCFKCGETKPLSDFYTHPQMADGHLNKCKECARKDRKAHETNNPSAILATRLSACKKNPTARNAYRAVEAAIKAGVICKPRKCSMCNRPDTKTRIEAHHSDYTEPLDVIWLCTECHARADEARREQEGEKAKPFTKPVLMVDGERVVCRFASIKEAAQAVGKAPSSISECLSGKLHTCAGYTWTYDGER